MTDQMTDECEVCNGGILAPFSYYTTEGLHPDDVPVQRCDECKVYEGDDAAAMALASIIPGGIVYFVDPALDPTNDDLGYVPGDYYVGVRPMTHDVTTRQTGTPRAPRWVAECSCGETSGELTAAGMASGREATHREETNR